MKGLIPRTQLFLKQNSSTVLTCIGSLGVVLTAVSAVKATPKAIKLLDEAKEEKSDDLTKLEIIKIAGPAYIPSVLMAGATIGCIFGANILNKRQQASLASAYTVLSQAYSSYRSKVKDVFGEEGERKVTLNMIEDSIKEAPENGDKKLRFMDFYSLQIFDSTMEAVYKAEDYINGILNERGFVLLGEFYEALGTNSIIEDDHSVGWTKALINQNGGDHIAFVHDIITTRSGEECCIITPVIDPIPDYLF